MYNKSPVSMHMAVTPNNELHRHLPSPDLSPIMVAEPQPTTGKVGAAEKEVPVPAANAEELLKFLIALVLGFLTVQFPRTLEV